MNPAYTYLWMGKAFHYELTAEELIIRVAETERRIALSSVVAATYVKPTGDTSRAITRKSASLKQVALQQAMDGLKTSLAPQGALLLRVQHPAYRMQTVILDESTTEGKAFLRLLRERFQPVLQLDATSLDEAYRLLGAPIRYRLLLWLPKLLLLGVLVVAVYILLSSFI